MAPPGPQNQDRDEPAFAVRKNDRIADLDHHVHPDVPLLLIVGRDDFYLTGDRIADPVVGPSKWKEFIQTIEDELILVARSVISLAGAATIGMLNQVVGMVIHFLQWFGEFGLQFASSWGVRTI